LQVCLPGGVLFLHSRDEQESKLNIAGTQLHSGHLLL
jgi:hypothetical protein